MTHIGTGSVLVMKSVEKKVLVLFMIRSILIIDGCVGSAVNGS